MRQEFTSKIKREMLDRSGGICECHRIPGMKACGLPLGPGNTFFEHIVQCAIGGDNSADNGAALTRTCWKLKTRMQDVPIIKRVRDRRNANYGIRPRSRFRGWRRFDKTIVWNDR
jgi:hypothetical protein